MINFSNSKRIRVYSFWGLVLAILVANVRYFPEPAQALGLGQTRRVNIPYFSGPVLLDQGAIFWFGHVDQTSNHANVRMGYNDNELAITVHVFDRLLWYDTFPISADLENWDSITLYLSLDGNTGSSLTARAHKFVAQVSHWQARTNYQAAFTGSASGWTTASTNFVTSAGFRGSFNDTADDRGWLVTYKIPFSSLGLAGPPPSGQKWGMALRLNDRDDAVGSTASPLHIWPETIDSLRPSTWGQLSFGLPSYSPPLATPGGVIKIRQGLNGAQVPDAHVGGDTICGEPFNPNFFNGWGDANYAGDTQVNIQNQWDVADWPCFSKYYVTFPLDAIPAKKTVVSATLTLYQFGNAWGPPPSSLIHVLTVAEDWNENTITWNNAPLALENVSNNWVDPINGLLVWPGWARQWDVSLAAAQAYQAGVPLRLALYSTDGDYHSGKYFSSSDVGDWNATGRPTLDVTWGDVNDFSIDSATPPAQTVDVGGTASYDLQIDRIGNFASVVDLQATTTSSNLVVDITPKQVIPPAQATVTVTHLGSNPGAWHDISVSATAGSTVKTIDLQLLTGGSKVFLPVVTK